MAKLNMALNYVLVLLSDEVDFFGPNFFLYFKAENNKIKLDCSMKLCLK